MPSIQHQSECNLLDQMINLINNPSAYSEMLSNLFEDGHYSFQRALVLQQFTEELLRVHSHFEQEFKSMYNNMLFNNYHILEVLTLMII